MRGMNLRGWLIAGGVTFVGACGADPATATSGSSGGAGTTGDASSSATGTGDANTTADASTTGEASTAPTGGQGTGSTGEPNPSTTAEVTATSTGDVSSSSTGDASTGDASTGDASTGDASTSSTSSTGEPSTSSTGEQGSTSMGEPPPDATVLELSFSAIKRFDFTWAAANGATFYQLLERPAPDLGYAQIGGDIVGESISLTMPLHLRFGASYILKACNDGGCTDSEPVEVVDSMATAVGYFKASNTDPADQFGMYAALSADGKTLAVAAHRESSAATGVNGDQDDDSAQVAGAVYVFVQVNGVWSQQAYVKASNAGANDAFGVSIALSADGNTLAVGAPGEDSAATGINGDQANNAAMESGAVYVFTRANDAWSQQAYIKASNPGVSDIFGQHVALSADGNTLAVGAAYEDSAAAGINGDQASNTLASAGAMYVFTRANDAWSQQAYIKASNPGAADLFGARFALSADGNTLAVGADREDSAVTGIGGDQANNFALDAGAVYVFVRAQGAWSQQAYIKASNTQTNDFFGYSVALSGDGDTLAVGAWREDSAATGIDGDQANNAASEAGAVYVFVRANDAWSQQAYVKASNTEAVDYFGQTVALSDDGNTLAVLAQREDSAAVGIGGDQADNAATESGAAYVFVRAKNAWTQRAYVKAPNTDANDTFRFALGLSADGKTLMVGAGNEDSAATGIGGDQASNAAMDAGALYLF